MKKKAEKIDKKMIKKPFIITQVLSVSRCYIDMGFNGFSPKSLSVKTHTSKQNIQKTDLQLALFLLSALKPYQISSILTWVLQRILETLGKNFFEIGIFFQEKQRKKIKLYLFSNS